MMPDRETENLIQAMNERIADLESRIDEFNPEAHGTSTDLDPTEVLDQGHPKVTIWAKVGAHSGSGKYPWDEVRRNSADNGWETFANNMKHDDLGLALEVNLIEDVTEDSYHLVHIQWDADGDLYALFSNSSGEWPGDPVDGDDGSRDGRSMAGAFWARLSSSSSPFSWKEQRWDDTGNALVDWAVLAGGREGSGNAFHHAGYGSLPVDLRVLMRPLMNNADPSVIEFIFHVPHDGEAGDHTRLQKVYHVEEVGTIQATPDPLWDIASQSSNFGITISVVCRVWWNEEAASPTLTSAVRDFHFDTGGRLLRVGREHEHVIDDPLVC